MRELEVQRHGCAMCFHHHINQRRRRLQPQKNSSHGLPSQSSVRQAIICVWVRVYQNSHVTSGRSWKTLSNSKTSLQPLAGFFIFSLGSQRQRWRSVPTGHSSWSPLHESVGAPCLSSDKVPRPPEPRGQPCTEDRQASWAGTSTQGCVCVLTVVTGRE